MTLLSYRNQLSGTRLEKNTVHFFINKKALEKIKKYPTEYLGIFPNTLTGYIDPEYLVTQQLTEKSDVYSYGMLLLELVTGRHSIHDTSNLLEGTQKLIETSSKLSGLVDIKLGNIFDEEQLQVLIGIIKWCTQRESSARPSMKQVLRLLLESLDPMHGEFVEAMEGEGDFRGKKFGKGITDENEVLPFSDDGRIYLQSSSSTTRSFCSRSVLLEFGLPESPTSIAST